jgi:hypothetical protein
MLTWDPRDALVLAEDRARRLREERAVDQLFRTPSRAVAARRALAGSLRRAANRLDPAPLVHRPA